MKTDQDVYSEPFGWLTRYDELPTPVFECPGCYCLTSRLQLHMAKCPLVV